METESRKSNSSSHSKKWDRKIKIGKQTNENMAVAERMMEVGNNNKCRMPHSRKWKWFVALVRQCDSSFKSVHFDLIFLHFIGSLFVFFFSSFVYVPAISNKVNSHSFDPGFPSVLFDSWSYFDAHFIPNSVFVLLIFHFFPHFYFGSSILCNEALFLCSLLHSLHRFRELLVCFFFPSSSFDL